MSDMSFTARIDSRGRRLRTFIYANVLPSKLPSAVYIACCNTGNYFSMTQTRTFAHTAV
jgi:choline-glycine betaine transporter